MSGQPFQPARIQLLELTSVRSAIQQQTHTKQELTLVMGRLFNTSHLKRCKMPRGDRNPDAVIEERVLYILPYVSFLSRSDLWQFVSEEKDWNIDIRTLDRYIARAREILRENYDAFKQNASQNVLNNLIEIYKQAFLQHDFKLSSQIQKQIADLFGLNQTKLDLTSGGKEITGFVVKVGKNDE